MKRCAKHLPTHDEHLWLDRGWLAICGFGGKKLDERLREARDSFYGPQCDRRAIVAEAERLFVLTRQWWGGLNRRTGEMVFDQPGVVIQTWPDGLAYEFIGTILVDRTLFTEWGSERGFELVTADYGPADLAAIVAMLTARRVGAGEVKTTGGVSVLPTTLQMTTTPAAAPLLAAIASPNERYRYLSVNDQQAVMAIVCRLKATTDAWFETRAKPDTHPDLDAFNKKYVPYNGESEFEQLMTKHVPGYKPGFSLEYKTDLVIVPTSSSGHDYTPGLPIQWSTIARKRFLKFGTRSDASQYEIDHRQHPIRKPTVEELIAMVVARNFAELF